MSWPGYDPYQQQYASQGYAGGYSGEYAGESSVYTPTSSKPRKSKGKDTPSSPKAPRRQPRGPVLSFLFMVNELRIREPARDEYHHFIPPTNPAGYDNEIPSRVMRYNDGQIEDAPDYQWLQSTSRENPGERFLWRIDPQTQSFYEQPVAEFSKFAVFACNPLLPIMVVDDDPMMANTKRRWQLLQLFHPRGEGLRGLTQVATEDSRMGDGPGLVRYTAGIGASWIPNLIPEAYRRERYRGIPSRDESSGLGGELPIILGLMALSANPDPTDTNRCTNELFLGVPGVRGCWRRNRWAGQGLPRGYPDTPDDDPRGFLAIVFLDPANPEGSTPRAMELFQWYTAVVRES